MEEKRITGPGAFGRGHTVIEEMSPGTHNIVLTGEDGRLVAGANGEDIWTWPYNGGWANFALTRNLGAPPTNQWQDIYPTGTLAAEATFQFTQNGYCWTWRLVKNTQPIGWLTRWVNEDVPMPSPNQPGQLDWYVDKQYVVNGVIPMAPSDNLVFAYQQGKAPKNGKYCHLKQLRSGGS